MPGSHEPIVVHVVDARAVVGRHFVLRICLDRMLMRDSVGSIVGGEGNMYLE